MRRPPSCSTARPVRYVVAIVAIVLLLGGLGAVKGAQVATMIGFGREQAEKGPPPEAVGVSTAATMGWETTIDAIGSLSSERGVSISAEVPGVVSRILFDSGERVQEGEVLVELDASVEKAQLESAGASLKLAKTEVERSRGLAELGAISQQELDQSEATLDTSQAEVESLRAQIERKVVRAPFSGRLGIRMVDLGQYLASGTPITVLEAADTMFVDFTLPQERLFQVGTGMPVRVQVEGTATIEGTIDAVEPSVDASTRAIRVRAVVPSPPAGMPALKPGMFADVEVVLPGRAEYVTIPATALVHAPYGDSVFVVVPKPEDEPGMREMPDGTPVMVARQQFVRVGDRRGDFVAIVEGVSAGDKVVVAGAFKLRNGAPVFVSDAPLPDAELNPQPENR
jgi:membrane fusion protein, multidrug efflux system